MFLWSESLVLFKRAERFALSLIFGANLSFCSFWKRATERTAVFRSFCKDWKSESLYIAFLQRAKEGIGVRRSFAKTSRSMRSFRFYCKRAKSESLLVAFLVAKKSEKRMPNPGGPRFQHYFDFKSKTNFNLVQCAVCTLISLKILQNCRRPE